MKAFQTMVVFSEIVAIAILLSISALAQSGPNGQIRYKVDYQCNGERFQVDHCRHDDDGPNFPPTTPDKDYCLVYYPDRPKSGGFIVQKVELHGEIVKKLQTCGTQNSPQAQHTEPSAAAKTSVPTQPSTNANAERAEEALPLNSPSHCNNGMTLTVTACAKQLDKEYCEVKVEQNGKLAYKAVDLRERVVAAVRSCVTQAANSPLAKTATKSPATIANGKSFNPAYLNEMPSVDRVKEAMTANDAHETAVRQIWAFYELTEIIKELSGPREFKGFLPDEQKVLGVYQVAQYNVGQAADKAFPNNKPSEDLSYHFSRFDPKFGFQGVNIWQFFSEQTQSQYAQLVGADNARYAAKRAEEKRIATEALQANTQGSGGGSTFVRNDPGTLAARRCVELGGSALECIGKGFWTGLGDMAGVDPAEMHGSEKSGVYMNGVYTSGSAPSLSFATDKVTITSCGKLVPDSFSYTITKKPNQLLINVNSVPSSFVLSMGNDGRLSGPGSIDVSGQIIDHYNRVWMQRYHNGVIVPGDGYWDSVPVYAPKTERCTIGGFAPAPPPPPEKNPLISGLTSAMNSLMPQGPTGLRMAGHYAGQGGLTLEFDADAVTLDCGAAHVKDAYTVENGSNQILITVKNGASPVSMALSPTARLRVPETLTLLGVWLPELLTMELLLLSAVHTAASEH
ncbi:MAG TPA: hypothetical protein VLK33_19965 [Terriglobales bacterium]|nr:hypothetical protein [Terriglobales bacterium]